MVDILTVVKNFEEQVLNEGFLREDTTITVGPSGNSDYLTLNEALAEVQKKPVSTAKGAANWGAERSTLWTIQLESGDVDMYKVDTLTNGQIRLENQLNQIRILGNPDGTTRLVEPANDTLQYGLWFKINQCSDIKFFDILEIEGHFDISRSNIKMQDDKATIPTTTLGVWHCWPRSSVSMYYDNIVVESMTANESTNIDFSGNVRVTGIYGLSVSWNAVMWVAKTLTLENSRIRSDWGGEFSVEDDIIVEATQTETIFDAQRLAKIEFGGTFTNNSTAPVGGVINEISHDGSYISNRQGPLRQKVKVESSTNTLTPDTHLSDFFELTLTADGTVDNMLNAEKGQRGDIVIKQDATGGWTPTFGTAYIFPAGLPDINKTADVYNTFKYTVIETDKIQIEFVAEFL